jgi:hypothetical protein
MSQETKVKLTSKLLKETREYEITHAERILAAQPVHGGDWVLDDKQFTLKKNGTIEHAGTGKGQSSQA